MKKKKVVRKRVLAQVVDYKRTFETVHGKRVLWDLMKNSSMLGTSFAPDNAHTTSYNEGGRAVILHILKKLNTNIIRLEQMISEGHESDTNDDNIFGESVE